MPAPVFSSGVNGPATHALVIGVGNYPHLPGGSAKKKYAGHDGMGQLKSPPESARSFARWLVEKYESGRALASVTLLVSEKKAQPFEYQRANGPKQSVPVPPATMGNVDEAIKQWRALGKNPQHLLLFYFCGHGIAGGPQLALLLEDFGADAQAPLKGALDFRRFHAAMDECPARNQCYFVDACRTGSELLEKNLGYAGDPVIHWTGAVANPGGEMRRGPIFFSTLANAKAYARPARPSVFTEALLDSLAGAGSGDETGPWEVKATRLHTALDFLMKQESYALGMPQEQIPSADSLAELTLNTLDVPAVPVFVRVEPAEAHAVAALRCEGAVKRARPQPHGVPWRLTVQPGKYSFFAEFKAAPYQATALADEIVRPPYWGKPLKVKP